MRRSSLRALLSAALTAAALAALPAVAMPARADWNGRCAARQVAFTAQGKGDVLLGPGHPVTGDALFVNGPAYKADGVTVTLKMQKTTFVIAPGSFFRPECFGAYGKGPYPSVKLYIGSAHVTGTKESPAQTGVRTWEAVAHTLTAGEVEYTVSRRAKSPADGNAGQGRVTVEVEKGGPIMLSPRVGIKNKWACTTGQEFTVDWLGRLTKK
jgi:hypothetical protein